MDEDMPASGLTRRALLRTGAGGVATAAAVGTAGLGAAQSGAAFDGYLSNVSNYDGVVDRTGQDRVTVTVGASGNGGSFAFGPAAIRVDPGTTVVWKWNGKGGGHNVVAEDGSFDSGAATTEGGTTFEYTFEDGGVTTYACVPHKPLGMKGAVVVGDVDVGGAAATTAQATPGTTEQATPTTKTVPDLQGYLEDADNYDGTVEDLRGESQVSVTVGAAGNGGNFAFGPPAIHVDPGTTVVWEWNGEGGAHNVVDEEGAFDSGTPVEEAGTTFEYTFEGDGLYRYYCTPHKPLGMKAVVIVGTDYPTKEVTVTPSTPAPEDTPTATPQPTAGNHTAAQTLLVMLGLGFLSPVAFALLLRWRGGGGPGE